ncbi:NAD-dependent protein deacetylase Sirt7-like [Ylistrum balloti]|uniref:NAD-dependent protein deacetylase Sirt7-like n=1 Tax=Ylistrum balloti TaxID=509963 RepID=UPI002905ACC7|nr:NAD-dependent protein deacetylase Sirt7-like [Ylistrum balloti]
MADEEEQESTESVDEKSDDEEKPSTRNARKCSWLSQSLLKKENRDKVKQISKILKKIESEKTKEDLQILANSPEITKRLTKQALRRDAVKKRTLEIKDPEDVLQKKCEQLADAIKESKSTVIYTGAGISTAASIPDYRGPNGVWTLLLKGQQPAAQDLSDAEPTVTHMCITELEKEGHVNHIVSQNCDGLHLRSGFPRKKLSEVHGNMYIELCNNCKPPREYVRLFDVTEKTGVRRHSTDRNCHNCKKPLRDTIVHFGEKGGVKTPYRWKEAGKAADNCDLILCLGTSLKILKMYACLWCMDRRPNRRPKLYIVNLQWTPKDDSATLKINGCCDDVMKRVMDRFGYTIPSYSRNTDPIFRQATPLKNHELKNVNKKILEVPANYARKRRIASKRKQCSMKKLKTDSISVSVSGEETKTSPYGVTSSSNGICKNEDTREEKFSDIKSRLHVPMQTISSNSLPCTVSSPSQETMSFPLDLSRSGTQDRTWKLDEDGTSLSDGSIPQSEWIGQCSKCAALRTVGSLCSCSTVPTLQPQGIPIHYMSYLGLQMLGDPRLIQLPPLHTNLWPTPFIPQVFQPSNKIDYVLKDHCYLKKDQMQKLSPKSERLSGTTSTSPVKRELHSQKECGQNNASTSSCQSTETSSTELGEQSPAAVVGKDMLLLTSQDTVPNTRHKRSNTSHDHVVANTDVTDSTTKKPNLCRSLSVPGWFGKGLKIGKKKR